VSVDECSCIVIDTFLTHRLVVILSLIMQLSVAEAKLRAYEMVEEAVSGPWPSTSQCSIASLTFSPHQEIGRGRRAPAGLRRTSHGSGTLDPSRYVVFYRSDSTFVETAPR